MNAGSIVHPAPECRIRHENRFRLDYYMLTPEVFIHLPQTRAQNRYPTGERPGAAARRAITYKQGAWRCGTRATVQPISPVGRPGRTGEFATPDRPVLAGSGSILVSAALRDAVADVHLAEELVLPERKSPLKHQEEERDVHLAPGPPHRRGEAGERQDIPVPARAPELLHHSRDRLLVPLVVCHRHHIAGAEVEIRLPLRRSPPALPAALLFLRRLQLLDQLVERDRRPFPEALTPQAALDLALQATYRLALIT